MHRAKFADMSLAELKREILRRQRALPQLIAWREALDKQIAELQGLGEAQAVPTRLGRKLGKKRARKTLDRMKAGSLADKLAEVFQTTKSPSLAEAAFLADENRFRAALGAEKDRPALVLADEDGKERAALPADAAGSTPHLADRNGNERAVLRVVEDGSKLHLADEDGKAVFSAS